MNRNQFVACGVTMLIFAALAPRADAGTSCSASGPFAIDNVIGGIACDVSATFAINNVLPDLMCNVSATFTINNIPPAIPTVSQWGVVVVALLTLTSGTVIFGKRCSQSAILFAG